MNKKDNEYKFAVLPDKPLENKEDDIFGHDEIAKSVVEVIKKSPRPFNIGIYGQWGVGKSTICKIIQGSLSKEGDYEILYFDTWKYERDSFRRQFLIKLDEDLRLGLNYKEKLNQSLSIPFNLSWFESLKASSGNFFFRSALLVISGLLGILIFKQIIFPYLLSEDYAGLAKRVVDLGIISILLTFVLDTMKQFSGEKTVDKTDSAEGFEEYFVKALKEIRSRNLLVIIDNLDRLSSEKAVSLLSDVKTFLSDENYSLGGSKVANKTVFVVPCDNKAINDQLTKEYGTEFDTEEYLRKFFNHSIQIPKFLNVELDDFIVKKLNATKITEFEENYDLVFILSYAFRNNPREIIQFINSLISLYVLAKERKIDRIIDKEHIAFLAKILVLRVKWPKLYGRIEDRALRTGDKLHEIVSRVVDKDDSDKPRVDEFLRVTSHIDDDEAQDIYFSLRQSDPQKTVPEWNSFALSLIEGRKKDAEKIYEAVKSAGKLPQLGQLLADYCRRHMQNENLLFNILLAVHKMIETDDTRYFQDVFLLTFKAVGNGQFVSNLEKFDFGPLFKKGLEGVSSANKKEFSQHLLSVIAQIAATETIERERITHVRKLFDIIDSTENQSNFQTHNSAIADAKRDFVNHLKYQELFPDAEKSSKFRKDILTDVLDILLDLGPLNRKHYAVGLTLFGNLLQWSPIIESDEVRSFTLEKSLEFVEKTQPPTSSDATLGTNLNTFTTRISTWYSANKSVEERALCVKIFQKIDLDINPNNEPAASVKRYVAETGNNADAILETLGKDFLIEDENARGGLIQRSRSDIDLLSKLPLKRKLTDDEKADIFRHIIGNPERALSFLEYVSFSVPESIERDANFRKSMIQNMINSSSYSDVSLVSRWLDAISKLGVQADQVDSFVQKLRQIRNQSEQHKSTVADFVSKNSKDFGELIVKEFHA